MEFVGLNFLICVCLFSLRIVNGEPTVSVRPNAAQKFQRNKQAGGGAYIPATIHVEGPREHKKAVLDRVLSGEREWRADDNRYRKLEHTMIHDVQFQN